MGMSITSAERGQLLAELDRIQGSVQAVREHLEVAAARQGKDVAAWARERLDRLAEDSDALLDAVNVAPLNVA